MTSTDRHRRAGRSARMVAALLAAGAATVALSVCTPDATPSEWTATTDTVAGVVRVTHTPPSGGAAPTLVAEEGLRIGTLEGEGPDAFGLIRSIAVLPDGRVAVADAQASVVRVFGADGGHLRTFGGQGQGPGELSGMQGVLLDHEGMLRVPEQGNARISVFDPDSGFVDSFPLRFFSYGARGPWPAAMDETGRTLVASSGQYGEGRFWNMLRVYDAEMRQLDSIPYYEYTDVVGNDDDSPAAWRIALGTGSMYVPVPYFARPHEAIGPTGEFWTTTEGAAQLEMTRWTPPGDTTLIVRSLRGPDPLTGAERDAALAAVRARLEERLPDPPSLDPARVPTWKPPVYGISLDERGRVWVRITGSDVDSTTYEIFERDGRRAETATLPFRVDEWIPPTLAGESVWAVVTDETDVQYVVRARLRAVNGSDDG